MFLDGTERVFKLVLLIAGPIIGLWLAIGIHHFLFVPRYYFIDDKGIIIERRAGKVIIAFLEITNVSIINQVPLWWVFGCISTPPGH